MDPLSCEQVCRICASHGTDYTSIFDENSDSLDEKINQCLPISVSEYDRLPLHICSECLNDLLVSYELREKSLKSEKQSREQNAFCAICEINFDDTVQFNGHMKELHLSEWTCNLCDENFKTSGDLFQHKYTNHYDNMDDFDEAGGNIDKLASEDDASINADELINRKDRGPPSTTDNSFTTRPTLKTLIICDICNVGINNENEMVYHRKFHAPRLMTCWRCDLEYETAYDYYLHKRDVHKYFEGQIKKYCCEKCGSFISCFRVLKSHINCEFVKSKCPYCEQELPTRADLIIHKNKYHREDMKKDLNTKKWNCTVCGNIFLSASDYRKHRIVHKKIKKKARKHKCEQCDKVFCTASSLKVHVDGVHTKLPKYQCELCLKQFRTNPGLRDHEKRHRAQACQECKKQFGNFHTFSTHMKKVHNVILPVREQYACEQCPRKFSRMRELQDHENTHTGKQPYSCEICHQRFRTYGSKWLHGQRHKREAYTCDICKREFNSKTHLTRHILGHMPPENWEHQCKVCKTRFKTRWHARDHMRVHSAPSR